VAPTDPDLERRRRGFWLRIARERANLSQQAAAKELGLSAESKSTLSAWESGAREPKASMLAKMARLYGVPMAMFADPDPTAHELIDRRLDELAREAARLERQDWEKAQAEHRAAEDGPADAPDTRSA
jgi:transcriptional regulator with XRE-family HTH domain